jgi:hypothetical protein
VEFRRSSLKTTSREVREPSWSRCFGIEFADSTVRAYDEGEGEGIPVFVGVGGVLRAGFEGCPVFPLTREMSVPLEPTVSQSFRWGS